jgi:predicted PurR-regulated permease PerM
MQTRNKYLLLAAGLSLGAIAVWYFSAIFIYILCAAVLSLLGRPFVKWYGKVKIGKFSPSPTLRAAMAMLTILIIFLSIISVFIPLVLDEIRIISTIDTGQVMESFRVPLHAIEEKLNAYNNDPSAPISIDTYVQQKLGEVFSFARVSSILNSLVSLTGSLMVAFFAIMFMTFFFLKDEKLIYNSVLLITPQRHSRAVKIVMLESQGLLERYFIGVIIEVAAVTCLVALGLWMFGVNNWLIIAFFAGIINIIPYVGPLIGAAFGILIGISTSLHLEFYSGILPLAGKIAGVFVFVQLVDGLFLQPMIYSNTVKAHPLEIFLVILFAGSLAGITGMVLAIPTYTIIRVFAKEFLNNFRVVKKLTEDLEEI